MALFNLSFTRFTHAGYHIVIFMMMDGFYFISAHVCKNLQFLFSIGTFARSLIVGRETFWALFDTLSFKPPPREFLPRWAPCHAFYFKL